MEKYFVVRYEGPFGFIKPWTAVRDGGDPKTIHTYSQQFLTPSIVEGIEKKLFPELLADNTNFGKIFKIKRHRLTYSGISGQMEVIQASGFEYKKGKGIDRPTSILTRGILLNPELYLAFECREEAQIAATQHICLCRNEDILYPNDIFEINKNEFSYIEGFELHFEKNENAFMVGYNRFDNVCEMYGWLDITDNPIKNERIL